jgi:hypothetical protein
MNIATLRKKARGGLLEVEDLLQAAIERQPGLSEELPRLATECGWQSKGLKPDGTRVVPLEKWAEVASAYAAEGFAGLRVLVQDTENVPFILGLVEAIKTKESIAFILEICGEYLTNPAQSEELALRVAAAFNMLLSFKQSAPVTAAQAKDIQNFLFALYPHAKSEANRSTVLLALRGIGDEDAIRFTESAQNFNAPWENTKRSVLLAIRKRLKKITL